MARDAIQAASTNNTECGILDTDLMAAFCNMVSTWCYMVMIRKGLSETVINHYRNLYDDNFSIVVVNNLQCRCIKNVRQSIRQGNKFAMELFTYGMDTILGYLSARLKGILIHSTPVEGPLGPPGTQPPTRPQPPPAIPGLPALPPQPADQPPRRRGRRIQVLRGIETRYILYAFCDDLKPAITSTWEFLLVERVMTLFEMSSGCKMHRTAISQKCKFLALGKWKTKLQQHMIHHPFFSQHVNARRLWCLETSRGKKPKAF